MKLKKLVEEYYSSIKPEYKKNEEMIDVFINPTKAELRQIVKDRKSNVLRYIIDLENKKLYVFNFNLLHAMVARKLKILYGMADSDKAIFGVGTFVNGKLSTGRKGAIKAIKENIWLQGYFK